MGEVIKTMKYDDLPPARAALAALNAEIAGAEAELRTLRSGKAKLDLDLTSVRNTETELAALVDADARDIVTKLRSGVTWVLDQVGGDKAEKIAERLAASKHRAAVAERALTATEGEIAALEARIVELKARRPPCIVTAVREAAEGVFSDYAVALEHVRECMVILSGLERFAGIERLGRVTGTLPDYGWSDGLPDLAVVASERSISRAREVWSDFAEALAADPRAPVDLLDFPPDEPDETIVYHELSTIERRRLDVQNANAPRN